MRCKIGIFCLAVIVTVISVASVWCQDFFKGKGIQILVGYPTGGGVDAEARLLGKYLERHLAGNPAVTVRNMPGAAGLVAANWFEQFAKPERKSQRSVTVQMRLRSSWMPLRSKPHRGWT